MLQHIGHGSMCVLRGENPSVKSRPRTVDNMRLHGSMSRRFFMPAAVILAGDRIASKPIQDDNKAFLEFRGEPMYVHVVRALGNARSVDSILIVGPRDRLLASLDQANLVSGQTPITVVNQGVNLMENVLIGYLTSLGVDFPPNTTSALVDRRFDELADTSHRETPVLVLSCDIPLVTSFEIDEFIENSDMQRYDYAVGVSDEAVMAPYYPTETAPGMRMTYFHFAESRCRHNNLHFGKPLKATEMHNVERMYELRYQKKIKNILKMTLHFARANMSTYKAVRIFLLLQIARSLGERQRGKFYEWIRSKNTIEGVTSFVGGTIGLRMQLVFSRYGGAVLDVDNAHDLTVAEEMHDRWMDFQKRINEAS